MNLKNAVYKLGQNVNWTPIESLHSASGTLPLAQGINAEIYFAQIKDCDARKAEALTFDQAVDPLLLVRSLLFRGRFPEARSMISELKLDHSHRASDLDLAKLIIEEARLAAFNGQWKTCAVLCEEAAQFDLAPITRLTLLQVNALASFELGDFPHAKTNLNLIDSLSRLFPKCITVFYAELLKIRIQAREFDPSSALKRLREVWLKWIKNEEKDMDQLQALLRVEVDLRRLAKLPHFSYALTSYTVADAMGEDLYSALAVLDCFISVKDEFKPLFADKMIELERDYPRVSRILNEIKTPLIRSTSVEAMINYTAKDQNFETAPSQVAFPIQSDIIVIPEYELFVTLNPFTVSSLEKNKQFVKVFQTLKTGPRLKADFFKEIWGNQKYSPMLHDNLIYTLLYRMKKTYKVSTVIRNGAVCLYNAVVVQ